MIGFALGERKFRLEPLKGIQKAKNSSKDLHVIYQCTHHITNTLVYRTEEKSDFDFWDEPNATSKSGPPRRVGPGLGVNKQPRGSAKKKTTSLDGILSSMRRHRKMDQMDKPSPTPNPT